MDCDVGYGVSFDPAHDPVPKIIKQILTHAIELVVFLLLLKGQGQHP